MGIMIRDSFRKKKIAFQSTYFKTKSYMVNSLPKTKQRFLIAFGVNVNSINGL